MAITQYVTANRLTNEANQARKRVLLYGLPIVVFLLLANHNIGAWALIFFLIILFKTGTIKRAGAQGEDSTLKELATLPNTYTIFNQVLVPNKESRTGTAELDFIIIGPNGVFVVEVKNNNSRIFGTEGDKEWTIYKMRPMHGIYE